MGVVLVFFAIISYIPPVSEIHLTGEWRNW